VFADHAGGNAGIITRPEGADLHAHFIFRCGFHKHEGRVRRNGGRHPATGASEVIVVNPDQDAARRIAAVAGPHIPITWVPRRIQDWLVAGGGS